MLKNLFLFFAATLFLSAVFGCSDDLTSGDNSTGDTDSTGTNDTDADTDADSDTSGDTSDDSDTNFAVCGEVTSDLTRIATRLMLLEDKSLSMEDNNKWGLAMDAIEAMVTDFNNDIAFGLDLFSVGSGNNDMCAVGDSVVLDAAVGNADAILQELAATGPANATPLYLAMSNYTDPSYASVFLDNTADSYLVIISDGMDTCGPTGVFAQDGSTAATTNELETVTAALLADYGIRTFVIGFGTGADPDQLNAIAAAGGTEYSEYIPANDGAELTAVLQDIAQTVAVSCRFEVGTFDDPEANLDFVNVLFDGVPVPRDDDCAAQTGWRWRDAERTEIEFCTEACGKLESDAVEEIKVTVACDESDVVIIVIE